MVAEEGIMEEALIRLYHRYEKWEDYLDGMWRVVPKDEEETILHTAIQFTGDAELYGSFMMRVIEEWPIACEQNLTNEGMNRLAWIGHAATSMAIKAPEYVTRRAWSFLTDEQRNAANEKAQLALDTWTFRHRSDPRQYALEIM